MQIFKYELPIQDRVTVPMPDGAKILTLQPQRGAVTIWAEVNVEARRGDRYFRIVGTGHNFDQRGLIYVGTAQSGLLVWHVYEETRTA